MTRSERNSLAAILTAIALIVSGIVAAVLLGTRSPHDAQALTQQVVEPATGIKTDSTAENAPDPLAEAEVNRIISGVAPEVVDTFGTGRNAFEYFRSWEGDIQLWQDDMPQIIPGPESNWFPAGQPGCGEGRYVVEFAGVDKLTAQLHDPLGQTANERNATSAWMLLDDCHIPYIAISEGTDAIQSTVAYQVHEYQPAG